MLFKQTKFKYPFMLNFVCLNNSLEDFSWHNLNHKSLYIYMVIQSNFIEFVINLIDLKQ